jgi:uncharacterized protein YkwD
MAHVLDSKDPGDRLRTAGYRFLSYGENIAAGQRSPTDAIADWMTSPGHRSNILNPSFTEIGVGIVASPGGGYYYTQVFATPLR